MAVVLVLDDEPIVLTFLCQCLERHGHQPLAAWGPEEAVRLATKHAPALALVDLDLHNPGTDGLGVFAALRARLPHIVGVVLTGRATLQWAFDSGRVGIARFVEKPIAPDELGKLVDEVLAARRPLLSETGETEEPGDVDADFDGMIGRCASMLRVFDGIRSTARLDHPVLIQGETGTGKELVARSIHGRSSRREGPFVPVNCAAVPPDLFESAFFGHERGAFTGAVESVPGYFEQARGGTLFLDEIGDLRLDAQAKFLRVIDFREVRRLGGTRAIRVDARVVAATNVDLEDAVRRGVFREDLFWRLRAFMLRLPPVRERGEDIGRLIDATLAKLRMELGLAHIGISDAARAVLLTHPWRGNVREVESVLRCAALLSGSGAIESPHLELAGSAEGAGSPEPGFSASLLPEGSKLSAFLASEKSRVERILIEAALKSSSGVRSVAAAKLGLDPRTLYTKMRQYDLGTLLDQPRSR